MKLSIPQVQTFWREWAKVIRYQKWTGNLSSAEIDAKRKELLSRAGFSSLTLVDKTAGFDRVLAELRALQDDVKRTLETEDPTIGQARRYRAVILRELVPCLALYEAEPERYLLTIVTSLVRWNKTDRPDREPTLEDLDAKPTFRKVKGQWQEGPSKLEQVMMTLNARLHDKRKEFGHSIHDMKRQAGVKCDCADCGRPQLIPAPVSVPAPEPEMENQPF